MKRSARQAGFNSYRKGNLKRRRYTRRRYSKKQAMQLVKVESKGMDTEMVDALLGAAYSSNTESYVVNLVRAGTGSWNRIGRKITPKSLRITGAISYQYLEEATTSNLAGQVLRMVVVYDKQPSGGTKPNYDTIFSHTTQDGTESTKLLDPVAYDNMSRFRVLKDCKYDLVPKLYNGAAGITNAVVELHNVDEYIKLNVGETVYSGDSSPMTISDISTGAIYVYFRLQDLTILASVGVDMVARLRYTDV